MVLLSQYGASVNPITSKSILEKAESLYLGQKDSQLVSWMCSITVNICLQGISFFFHSKHSQEGYDVASPKNTSYVTSLDVKLLTKKISSLAFTFSIGISCPSFAFSTQCLTYFFGLLCNHDGKLLLTR